FSSDFVHARGTQALEGEAGEVGRMRVLGRGDKLQSQTRQRMTSHESVLFWRRRMELAAHHTIVTGGASGIPTRPRRDPLA
ncbi:MAG TPA: hypothetical protein VM764_04655, partial [Gemmatimonadaceae bacterium]|nr:hypothetical protein [Gemmatimonadaceae bacterium]